MTDKRVVLSTTGTRQEAATIANELVRRRLAACVNIVGPIDSVYRWKGAVESSEEIPPGDQDDGGAVCGFESCTSGDAFVRSAGVHRDPGRGWISGVSQLDRGFGGSDGTVSGLTNCRIDEFTNWKLDPHLTWRPV